MSLARRSPLARNRYAAPAESAARLAWVGVLGQLGFHVRCVLEGLPIAREEAADLAHQVVRLKAFFPIRQACVASAAEATLLLARAFVAAAKPEERREVADLLQVLLAYLDRKLTDHGHQLAERSRRWAGDTD